MKNNLPYLTKERLNYIFNDIKNDKEEDPEKIKALSEALKAMQSFNYRYRFEDFKPLFAPMSKHFDFEINSEGTSIWLAMALAIKELYGFSDTKIVDVLKMMAE